MTTKGVHNHRLPRQITITDACQAFTILNGCQEHIRAEYLPQSLVSSLLGNFKEARSLNLTSLPSDHACLLLLYVKVYDSY